MLDNELQYQIYLAFSVSDEWYEIIQQIATISRPVANLLNTYGIGYEIKENGFYPHENALCEIPRKFIWRYRFEFDKCRTVIKYLCEEYARVTKSDAWLSEYVECLRAEEPTEINPIIYRFDDGAEIEALNRLHLVKE